MKKRKKRDEITVKELIDILGTLEPDAIVINGYEKKVRVYPGKENKKNGRPVVMIC